MTNQVLTGATLADIAGAKRLLFESQTMVLASLQEKVNVNEQTVVKKVPVAERETKMKLIKQKLCGLLIEGPLEPGHSLLDLTAHMMNLNEIRYVAPEKCVSRTHEILNQKTPSKQIDVSAESLVVREKTDIPEMTVTSALQVQEAFQSRGISLVFADLVRCHDSYSRYITTLFSESSSPKPSTRIC